MKGLIMMRTALMTGIAAMRRIAFGGSIDTAMKIHDHAVLDHAVFHIATGYHGSRRSPGCNANKRRKRRAQTRGGKQ